MTDDELADALTQLPLPRPSPLALGYAAGLAAGRRRSRAWQATTALALAGCVAVAVHRPPPVPVFVDRVVYARPDAAVTAPPLPMADATAMLRFRQLVLNDPTLASVPITGGHGRPPGPTGSID